MSINQNSDSTVETELLEKVYAAINQNDIATVLTFCDSQVERIEPAGFPLSGTYRGHAELKAHLSQGRDTWAEGSCEPERFIVAGDKIVVFLYVRVRLKNKQDWIEGRFADGFIVRNNKVLLMRTFAERDQALEWAGIKDFRRE